jgi:hypothetical protein
VNNNLIKSLAQIANPNIQDWQSPCNWTPEQVEHFSKLVVQECVNQIQLQRINEESTDQDPEFTFRKGRARAFRYSGLWSGIKAIKSHFGVL